MNNLSDSHAAIYEEPIDERIRKFLKLEDYFLFDSLINNVVNRSYLDNFKVRKISGRKTELNDFEKPIFLMTYASWCTPGSGEVPALNDIA